MESSKRNNCKTSTGLTRIIRSPSSPTRISNRRLLRFQRYFTRNRPNRKPLTVCREIMQHVSSVENRSVGYIVIALCETISRRYLSSECSYPTRASVKCVLCEYEPDADSSEILSRRRSAFEFGGICSVGKGNRVTVRYISNGIKTV